MGTRPASVERSLIPVGPTSSRLVVPDQAWRRINNMYPTEAGGLRSVTLPIPYLTNNGNTPDNSGPSSPTAPVSYGICRSVFHAVVSDGARELLLAHVDNQIWEFMGWDQGWRVLVGSGGTAVLEQNLKEPLSTDFPTQWVRTPRGVVIIPQGGQACFYDGTMCLRLGYTDYPGPPIGMGPQSSAGWFLPDLTSPKLGLNDLGYAIDGLAAQADTGMPTVFKQGRLGTVVPLTGSADPTTDAPTSGHLADGLYRCRVQWIDRFGNMSPLSPPSNDITFDRQPAMQLVLDDAFEPPASPGYEVEWVRLGAVKKQVGWASLMPGPDGTIGRILYRTKDVTGKGDSRWYEVPADASSNSSAFATIPDNITEFYPDNIPDGWLFNEAPEIEPVPAFRLAEVAFGRLFAANSPDDPGRVWVSMVGRYGTLERKLSFYPDPEGAEVTGMKRVSGGLLMFSRGGTYLVVPNDTGEGFRSQALDSTKGCVAPSSIKTLRRSDKTIWLGRDGFYSWSPGSGVQFEFDEHTEYARRFNRGRLHLAVAEVDPRSGQYRCWVPMTSSQRPDLCWCFDEILGWSTRDDIEATGVTVTSGPGDMMVCSGRVDVDGTSTDGIWVLDRAGEAATAEVWTSWQRAARSAEPASQRRVKILLRETYVSTSDSTKLEVTFERDYRVGAIGEPVYASLYPDEATAIRPHESAEPHSWGGITWGEATFRERRPFWVSVDTDLPECEVWRMRLTSPVGFEILGFSYEEQPRIQGGAAGYE